MNSRAPAIGISLLGWCGVGAWIAAACGGDRAAESRQQALPTIDLRLPMPAPPTRAELGSADATAPGGAVPRAPVAARTSCEELAWLVRGELPVLMPIFGNGELQRVKAVEGGLSIDGKVYHVKLPHDAEPWSGTGQNPQHEQRVAAVELGDALPALAVSYVARGGQTRLAVVRWRNDAPALLGSVGAPASQATRGLAVQEGGQATLYAIRGGALTRVATAKDVAALCDADR